MVQRSLICEKIKECEKVLFHVMNTLLMLCCFSLLWIFVFNNCILNSSLCSVSFCISLFSCFELKSRHCVLAAFIINVFIFYSFVQLDVI